MKNDAKLDNSSSNFKLLIVGDRLCVSRQGGMWGGGHGSNYECAEDGCKESIV